jgi:NADH:ubiquinone oxidoreductase subunit E
LGACDRAPVMMVGDDLVTHLDTHKISEIFASSKSGDQS